MEKLVVVTQTVDVYEQDEVETISYESKEKFIEDHAQWKSNPDGDKWDRFQNTLILRHYVNELGTGADGSWEVYTLDEFFEIYKVN